MNTKASYQRFVPSGKASVVDDAPGWGNEAVGDDDVTIATQPRQTLNGPVCWKCRGSGGAKNKKRKCDTEQISLKCSVCNGVGRLPPKRAEMLAATRSGVITRGRRQRPGQDAVTVPGPLPYAMEHPENDCERTWTKRVAQACKDYVDITCDPNDLNGAPEWVPKQGEELCNLVGSWRILQKVGSHRWTTDDLVTAYVAAREVLKLIVDQHAQVNYRCCYLDLGTGNASVLQMATWALMTKGISVDATGVEARSEAVNLARRSLSFNADQSSIRIIHGDFRDVNLDARFDLVTGTPPYFRVDFSVNQNGSKVTSAIINQGGMPTARQSAPARCEFRGGIEAYCEAAARALKPETGIFVVCENWLNHDRVIAAAKENQLYIIQQNRIRGREGRDTLFCVYVMVRGTTDRDTDVVFDLTVRDSRGNWTKEYTETVLRDMGIVFL